MSAEIKPYRISIGDAVLDDLKSRLRNTRWPEAELRVSRKDLKLPGVLARFVLVLWKALSW
jgi:hypothetical protein